MQVYQGSLPPATGQVFSEPAVANNIGQLVPGTGGTRGAPFVPNASSSSFPFFNGAPSKPDNAEPVYNLVDTKFEAMPDITTLAPFKPGELIFFHTVDVSQRLIGASIDQINERLCKPPSGVSLIRRPKDRLADTENYCCVPHCKYDTAAEIVDDFRPFGFLPTAEERKKTISKSYGRAHGRRAELFHPVILTHGVQLTEPICRRNTPGGQNLYLVYSFVDSGAQPTTESLTLKQQIMNAFTGIHQPPPEGLYFDRYIPQITPAQGSGFLDMKVPKQNDETILARTMYCPAANQLQECSAYFKQCVDVFLLNKTADQRDVLRKMKEMLDILEKKSSGCYLQFGISAVQAHAYESIEGEDNPSPVAGYDARGVPIPAPTWKNSDFGINSMTKLREVLVDVDMKPTHFSGLY